MVNAAELERRQKAPLSSCLQRLAHHPDKLPLCPLYYPWTLFLDGLLMVSEPQKQHTLLLRGLRTAVTARHLITTRYFSKTVSQPSLQPAKAQNALSHRKAGFRNFQKYVGGHRNVDLTRTMKECGSSS